MPSLVTVFAADQRCNDLAGVRHGSPAPGTTAGSARPGSLVAAAHRSPKTPGSRGTSRCSRLPPLPSVAGLKKVNNHHLEFGLKNVFYGKKNENLHVGGSGVSWERSQRERAARRKCVLQVMLAPAAGTKQLQSSTQ